jgi:probable phosphoglycerate mutase
MMKHSRFYLCRHGETDANATHCLQGSGIDLPLNERGLQQAEALATELKDIDVDVIVSSSLIVKFFTNAQIVSKH